MTARRPIRLLVREHGIRGGIETVNLHLIKEFTEIADCVVCVVPEWRLKFFQDVLPPSDRLIYRLPFWPREARLPHVLRKAMSFALRRTALPARSSFEELRQALSNRWLKRLVQEHQITHCFCNWIFCVDVPRLNVPVGTMLMDVRWKYFPETFPQSDVNLVDQQFCDWLEASSVV